MHECERQMKSEVEMYYHNWNYIPFSFRTVCGFFNVPQIIRNKCCEKGPPRFIIPIREPTTKEAD